VKTKAGITVIQKAGSLQRSQWQNCREYSCLPCSTQDGAGNNRAQTKQRAKL